MIVWLWIWVIFLEKISEKGHKRWAVELLKYITGWSSHNMYQNVCKKFVSPDLISYISFKFSELTWMIFEGGVGSDRLCYTSSHMLQVTTHQ